jgi:hypothetical protein
VIYGRQNYNHSTLLQHQQQVVSAVERAKQVTMSELNSIIGVSHESFFSEVK